MVGLDSAGKTTILYRLQVGFAMVIGAVSYGSLGEGLGYYVRRLEEGG